MPGLQESSLSAFSQWRAAASGPDLPAFLADTALVHTALLSISKAQATASQLAKTIADKTEAGPALLALPAALSLCSLPRCFVRNPFAPFEQPVRTELSML